MINPSIVEAELAPSSQRPDLHTLIEPSIQGFDRESIIPAGPKIHPLTFNRPRKRKSRVGSIKLQTPPAKTIKIHEQIELD
ncbi:MAG: hypothetical protein ACREUU_20305 [Gammaproteobacteria bacterium]